MHSTDIISLNGKILAKIIRKDVSKSGKHDFKMFYCEIVGNITTLYQDCSLISGDAVSVSFLNTEVTAKR